MRQYVNTYRITVSDEMKQKLDKLKSYNIITTSFIRMAIEEKLNKDMPKIKIVKPKIQIPF